jgi:hypothetical protein
MCLRAVRSADALMGQQAMPTHEPQDTAPAGANAGEAQPGPQLAVALAVERAVRHELADRHHQIIIRHGPEGSGPLALDRLGRVAVAIDGSPRHPTQQRVTRCKP